MCVEMARALADGPRRRAGRPRQLDLRVADRICREFRYGLGYRAIATRLNLDGVATAHGAAAGIRPPSAPWCGAEASGLDGGRYLHGVLPAGR
jgi:hypothetical protein